MPTTKESPNAARALTAATEGVATVTTAAPARDKVATREDPAQAAPGSVLVALVGIDRVARALVATVAHVPVVIVARAQAAREVQAASVAQMIVDLGGMTAAVSGAMIDVTIFRPSSRRQSALIFSRSH